MNRAKLQLQIKANSISNEETGCWEWVGRVSNSGYGQLMVNDKEKGGNRTMSAVDASYMAFFGALPNGSLAQQRCHNRLCVNPEHLTLLSL